MSKYRNAYRDDEDADQLEYAPDGNAPAQDENLNAEEETYKKRYSDLRRHLHAKETDFQSQLNSLKEQLASSTSQTMKLPKTPEEVEEWKQQFPDVFAVFKTVAITEAQEVSKSVDKRLQKVNDLERKINAREALSELKKLHPDFDSINMDPDFHAWMQEQDKWMQEAIYHNDTDFQVAADVLDLFKLRKGKKTKAQDNRSAASVVRRSESVAPSNRDRPAYSESQVQAMTPQEYDKHEDAIDESIRNGTYDYDITGGAR